MRNIFRWNYRWVLENLESQRKSTNEFEKAHTLYRYNYILDQIFGLANILYSLGQEVPYVFLALSCIPLNKILSPLTIK